MAAITITEILGGDNIAGSRLTINDNFKKLANGLNTVETFLNTSPAGGSLNIGNLQVLKYSQADTATLFSCQASGSFAGNLTVTKDISASQSVNAALDLTASRNITFDGTATGGGSLTSSVSSKFNGQFGSTQMYAAQTGSAAVNPQSLTQTGNTTRNITSVDGYRVLRVDLSTYNSAQTANNCDTVILPAVAAANQGQILTIIVDTKSTNAMTNFTVSNTNFAAGSMTTGIVFGTPNADGVYRQAVTVFGDQKGWRILNATGVTIS